ncbi:MAG: hypothetical protein AAF721_24410 [Myxococcota bacterium]
MSPKSRLLCAALGVLAEDAYIARGGARRVEDVGHTAALLSLLTKVDDEVIDARAFHGGPLRLRGHDTLRRRTRAYLAATLDSIRTGRPASTEARCELAAEIGVRLRSLSGGEARLDRLLAIIGRGWETQVRAVDILSRHPDATTLLQVARATRDISGDWLLMITMIGGLPAEASHPLTPAEERAFLRWGWHIQRADALADFGKDIEAGLANSWAGRVLHDRAPASYVPALRERQTAALRMLLQQTCSDRVCLPRSADALHRAAKPLAGLGAVAERLRWIHGMLVSRYADACPGNGAAMAMWANPEEG